MKTLALTITATLLALSSNAHAQMGDGVYTVRSLPPIHAPVGK